MSERVHVTFAQNTTETSYCQAREMPSSKLFLPDHTPDRCN